MYAELNIDTTSLTFLLGGVGADSTGAMIAVTSNSWANSVTAIAAPLATTFTL